MGVVQNPNPGQDTVIKSSKGFIYRGWGGAEAALQETGNSGTEVALQGQENSGTGAALQ